MVAILNEYIFLYITKAAKSTSIKELLFLERKIEVVFGNIIHLDV
jgi:hypothetical protein